MKLLAVWDVGPFFYQLWETETEYICQSIDSETLETICQGEGNTVSEAVTDGIRKAP